jgi:pimeloyl-ACP methyl ester carboxylesterase
MMNSTLQLKGFETSMPYEEWKNEGPLLVFLHGFPNNSHLWAPQVDAFKDRFHILNFNLPGSFHGRAKRRDFRTHHIQDVIMNVIKDRMKKHNKKAILVGHDLGTFILDEVGKQLSAHILGEVLISGMPLKLYLKKLKEPSQMLKSWYVGLLQVPGTATLTKKFLQKKLRRNVFKLSHIREDSPLYTEAPHGFEPIYLYRELAQKARRLKRPEIKSSIPTYFIFGENDRFLNPVTEAEAQELFVKPKVIIMKAGHWLNREKIEETNETLDKIFCEFLKGRP